jgi:hypothetical protein
VEFSSKQAKGVPPISIPVVLVPEGLKQKQVAKFDNITAELTAEGSQLLFTTKILNSKTGKEALYLNSTISATNIETGVMTANTVALLSNDHSIPGTSVVITATMEFSKLKDGVYKILFEANSDEGGLSIGKTINLVVNRDIANKVKVVNND